MEGSIVLIFPVHPGVFAIFFGVLVAYLAYSMVKLVSSLIAGG